MPNLSCNVKNCSHNSCGTCCLNCIDVDGGRKKENTFCSDFSENCGLQNSTNDTCSFTDVDCKAHDCVYNCNCRCTAGNINICTCGSGCDCKSKDDTECKTFKHK